MRLVLCWQAGDVALKHQGWSWTSKALGESPLHHWTNWLT